MLEPRFTRQIEITLKSHNPLTDGDVEVFLTRSFAGQRMVTPVSSEFRDVSFVIDDVGPPVAF